MDAANTPSQTLISAQTGKYAMQLLVAVAVLTPAIAMADPWTSAASAILAIFTSGLSRILATIAVIALGIMAAAGKLEWGTAIKVIIGLVLIFGAGNIVDWIITASSGKG